MYVLRFCILLLGFSCCMLLLSAQPSDFMILKKKERTIHTYFPGNTLQFQLDNGQWVEGSLIKLVHDSLYIEQQITKTGISYWGTPAEQKLNVGILTFAVQDIVALPYREKGIGIFKNGSLFQIAGGGYILLNAVNSIAQGTAFFTAQNMRGIGIAAGVFLLGKLLQWSHPTEIRLGKTYKLQIIHIN